MAGRAEGAQRRVGTLTNRRHLPGSERAAMASVRLRCPPRPLVHSSLKISLASLTDSGKQTQVCVAPRAGVLPGAAIAAAIGRGGGEPRSRRRRREPPVWVQTRSARRLARSDGHLRRPGVSSRGTRDGPRLQTGPTFLARSGGFIRARHCPINYRRSDLPRNRVRRHPLRSGMRTSGRRDAPLVGPRPTAHFSHQRELFEAEIDLGTLRIEADPRRRPRRCGARIPPGEGFPSPHIRHPLAVKLAQAPG